MTGTDARLTGSPAAGSITPDNPLPSNANRWRRWCRASVLFGLLAAYGLLMAVALAGCAQSTVTPTDQRGWQEMTTPTATDQEQATQGSSVNIWVINAPGKHGAPATPLANLADGEVATLLGQIDGPETDYQAASAGYVMGGIHITVTTGGTTPSVTGTATGTASATANPNSTTTSSPSQQVEPDVGITAPVGIAPGGLVDVSAAATGGAGASESAKTGGSTLTRQQLRALAEQYPQLAPLIEALLSQTAAQSGTKSTSQPADER